MSFFDAIKAVGAPKTEDPQYNQASELFKSYRIESAKLVGQARSLVKVIEEFAHASVKVSTDASNWIHTVDSENASDLKAQSTLVVAAAQAFETETTNKLALRIDPNFAAGLVAHDNQIAEVAKVREARKAAVREYDKQRELLRQAETAKKPKPDQIEKARAKSDEAKARYEEANVQFLDAVAKLTESRKTSLGDPLKNIIAIFSQFIQHVAPTAQVGAEQPRPAPEQKPAEQKSAEQKPVEQKPVEQKPAEQKPAERMPAEQKPAEPKAPEPEPERPAPAPHGFEDDEKPSKQSAKAQLFESFFVGETKTQATLPAVHEADDFGANPFDD
jgi:hypothetical protein